VSLHEPEVLIDTARYFGEDVGTILITDLFALADRGTRLGADLGERIRERLHVGATFGAIPRREPTGIPGSGGFARRGC